jgi:histone deacetylase 1/2
MYVDSNFAGMWHKEYSHLRDNVLSRTGYVILFGRCPITWASKLQTEIALSTTESKYIALTSATRDLLPLQQILCDLNTHSFVSIPKQTSSNINNSTLMASKIYEDNAACIVLATTTSYFKPRTKHISIKWHHFCDQIKNGHITILKVATDDNIADIFTKPLVKFKFEKLRYKLMGW